jgi:hypothetical protein
MAQKLSAFVEGHRESVRREVVFPHFSTVVKKHSGKQQVTVERWIGSADCGSSAHHLRDMLNQAATARMVVSPGGCGTAKAIAEVRDKKQREPAQARIDELRHDRLEIREIRGLALAQFCRTAQQSIALRVLEETGVPAFRVEAVIAALSEFARDSHKSVRRESIAKGKGRRIGPRAQSQLALRVGKCEFVEGLAVARFLAHERFNLAVQFGFETRLGQAGAFEAGDGVQIHGA